MRSFHSSSFVPGAPIIAQPLFRPNCVMHLSLTFIILFRFIHALSVHDDFHSASFPAHSTCTPATSQYACLNTIPSASLIVYRRTSYHSSLLRNTSLCCLILLSGDIETNPGPTPTCFTICTLNIQSLTEAIHSTAVADLAQLLDLDIIALSETWIKPETTPYLLAEATPSGYTLLSKHRPLPANYNPKHNLGGGLAFLLKENLTHISSTCPTYTSFESFSITVKLGHGNITIFNIYRPPSDSKHANTFSVFLDEFQSFLEFAATTPHDFIITGDFNIHVNKSDRQSTQFNDLLHAHNLNQHVTFPTHRLGNTLDLVITPSASSLSPVLSAHPVSPADHFPVISGFQLCVPEPPPVSVRTFRRIRSIDTDLFMSDLSSQPLITNPPSTLSDLVESYNSTLTRLLDKHAPLISKPLQSRPSNPWFTPYLHQLKAARRRLARAWKHSATSLNLSRLRLLTNLYHRSVINAKKLYHASLIAANKSQPRKLWQTVNTILHRRPPSILPLTIPTASLADRFASFFTDKITNLHSQLASVATSSSPHIHPPTTPSKLSAFRPASKEEVIKLIRQAPNKQCALDPIPMSLLKQCCHILAPVITNIVNLSLSTGVFPTHFKQALITPLIKKPSLDRESMSSYRPISNLSFLSKLTERIIKARLHQHLASNTMYNTFQSAYSKFHSTETTLLALHDHLISSMDRQQVTGLTLLDLSAAFDTIDHSILLHRLTSWFGISDCALDWFRSYLSDRSFSVSCSSILSSSLPLTCGVPQGSVLGPILFIMYTTPLSTIINQSSPSGSSSQVGHHLYADDTQLFISFRPDAVSAALGNLQATISAISGWMTSNFLSLNPSKTEFLIIGLPNKVSKLQNQTLLLPDNTTISPVHSAKNLGIVFDSSLSFDSQISSLSRACYFHIRDLRRIRRTLDSETARVVATSLVQSKLDYCNSLYHALPKSQIKRLQAIQNSLARCVTLTPRFHHITPVLKDLHWLRIEQRIQYKIISLTYSTLQHNSPVYLRRLLTFPPYRQSTRSSSVVTLFKPHIRLKTANRSFTFAAPTLWNSLPCHMRQPSSATSDEHGGCLSLSHATFHKHLKTYLFSQSYPP